MTDPTTTEALLEELLALRIREARYRLLLDESTDPIFSISPQGRYLYVNREFAAGVGMVPEDIIGRLISDVFSPDEASKRFAVVQWVCEHRQAKVFEVRVPRPSGDRYYITSVKPIFDASGAVVSVICISKDITERKEFERRLIELATIDALTAVPNRRHFLELAEQELARVKRYQAPLAIAMMDIDHFKQVNDTYGHHAGDKVLQEVAAVCRRTIRESDVIGRMGGEEFAILFPETDAAAAFEIAERLRSAIAATPIVIEEGCIIKVTASFGIASYLQQDADFGDLLKRADQALYEVKQRTRAATRWCCRTLRRRSGLGHDHYRCAAKNCRPRTQRRRVENGWTQPSTRGKAQAGNARSSFLSIVYSLTSSRCARDTNSQS